MCFHYNSKSAKPLGLQWLFIVRSIRNTKYTVRARCRVLVSELALHILTSGIQKLRLAGKIGLFYHYIRLNGKAQVFFTAALSEQPAI